MDAFWVIPTGIVGVIFCWALYAYIRRLPERDSPPNVVLDKPRTEPLVDPSAEGKDWEHRPAGSFLDWKRAASQQGEAK